MREPNPYHQASAARASQYRLLASAFSYPCAELHRALSTGEFNEAMWAAQDALSVPRAPLPRVCCDHAKWEAAYIGMFEIGRDGRPPCVLRESAHVDGVADDLATRPAVGTVALLEDLLRFYHHFGLRMTDVASVRELPDHLSCQLEMLSFLCFRESLCDAGHESARWYRSAQQDFLHRHLCRWVPRLAQSLQRRAQDEPPGGFYSVLVEATTAGMTAHLTESAGSARNE